MTREEAIGLLSGFPHCETCGASPDCSKCREALDMAIEALKQPKIVMCKNCKNSIEPCDGWDRRCKIFGVVCDDFFCGVGKPKDGEAEMKK